MKCIDQDREGTLRLFVVDFFRKKREDEENLPARVCTVENSMLFAQTHMRKIEARNKCSMGNLDDQ